MSRFNNKKQLYVIKEVLTTTVFRICSSYFFIFLITFLELFIGLVLLKVKYALVISAIIAIADIFPIIGTGTILIPWSIIELMGGNNPLALGLFTLYLIITVVRNIIEPKIIGKNSGVHPLATLAAMYIGLKMGGVSLAILLPFVLIIFTELNKRGVINSFDAVN